MSAGIDADDIASAARTIERLRKRLEAPDNRRLNIED
jgi:hypothetical protein